MTGAHWLFISLLLVSGWCIFPLHSFSQGFSVPSDTSQLLPTLIKNYEAEEKKIVKRVSEELQQIFRDPEFGTNLPAVFSTMKEMEKKKLRATPFLQYYVNALIEFHKAGLDTANFRHWSAAVNFIIRKKTNNSLLSFLEQSKLLFRDNALYTARGHEWKLSAPRYRILFRDEGQVLLEISGCDLICTGRDDSTRLVNTGGEYNLLDETFRGYGGQVYWVRHNLPQSMVGVSVGTYSINMRRATYVADSARFIDVRFFSDSLTGRFEEKLINAAEESPSSYPRFESYDKTLEIDRLGEGIIYRGGFALTGSSVLAKGDSAGDAVFIFYKNHEPVLQVFSRKFLIDNKKFTSTQARIIMKFADDSIYHPGVEFKYMRDTGEVSLLRIGHGTATAPFFNSLHKLEMFFEALYWNRKSDELRVSMIKGSTGSFARFRSASFYTDLEFERLQGMDETFPVIILKELLRKKGSQQFTVNELARYMKADVSEVRQLLFAWAYAGLINFDEERGIGETVEKFDFYIQSSSGLTDFDQIEFNSYSQKENATINIESKDFNMKGVNRVMLSDSQKVAVYPLDGNIRLEENRNFQFGGRINAGRMKLYGQDFSFNYDTFNIRMPFVDSARTMVPRFDTLYADYTSLVNTTTLIEKITGQVLIDESHNKSGNKRYPTYPELESVKDSYTFYDNSWIEGGVYDRERFYFRIYPFRFDSLDNFPIESFLLEGEMESADIFPVMPQVLRVMPDYSLGFAVKTVAEGLPAYMGKGFFMDSLKLSNMGLRGNGEIEYQTASVYSTDFRFYPDSMNVFSDSLLLENKPGLPEVPVTAALKTRIQWLPYEDKFMIYTLDKPISLYNNEVQFTGKLTLSPQGLEGNGTIMMGKAILTSRKFVFKRDVFESDTADFALLDHRLDLQDSSGVGMQTRNFRAVVSFIEQKGVFTSNEGISEVNFPQNKFSARIREVVWDIVDTAGYREKGKTVITLNDAEFYSSAKGRNQVRFSAERANFYLDERRIDTRGVEYIDVADSRIFPGYKNLMIRENATIDEIDSATIWVNKEEKRHVLTAGKITVRDGNFYSGSAGYEYINAEDTIQYIFFSDISVNPAGMTVATAEVTENSRFYLSVDFSFKGKVQLRGGHDLLLFDGYAGFSHNCPLIFNHHVRFTSAIDPGQVFFPVTRIPVNERNEALMNGFMFAPDTAYRPPVYQLEPERYATEGVATSDVYLLYDKDSSRYVITNHAALFEQKKPQFLTIYEPHHCQQRDEGRLSLEKKMGLVDMVAAGKYTSTPPSEVIFTDMLVTLDFLVDPYVMATMATKAGGRGEWSFSKKDIRQSIPELGRDSADAGELRKDGIYDELPEVLDKVLVLANVKYTWDVTRSKLVHSGPLYLMSVGGSQITRQVDAYMEVNLAANGGTFMLYIEFERNNWFVFSYQAGVMEISSSHKDFNDFISGLELSKRQYNIKGLPDYQFALAKDKTVELVKKLVKK